jgi:hypothetical protein
MRQAVGGGQVRLSVVLSKQQWRVGRVRESCLGQCLGRKPGPTSGLAIAKEECPWLRTRQDPLASLKAATRRSCSIGRSRLPEDARPHHDACRNAPWPAPAPTLRHRC